ncbi:hypothetical protein LUZ60_008097 [Juncus effusus]|nr:hypothetical protein LUZ60_008097 [Juncus effusus]
MESWIRAVVEAIHLSPTQAVLLLSGGASQALGWLMSVPGASSTVLEAVVPYSRNSMANLLRKIPSQFTSQKTAEEMALVAYNRALKFSTPGKKVLGVGFTGSLASSQPKRGDHRFFLSTRTHNCLRTSHVTLLKGLRDREEEDRVSSQVLVKAIADACNISVTVNESELILNESELPKISEKCYNEDEELQQLIDGQICMKIYEFSYDNLEENAERRIILPGSFNPLHEGHIKLLEIASRMCENAVQYFEISAINADKPPLSTEEIKMRVDQFRKAGKNVIISNQPYFYKKAELFPGSAFVIGADTAIRLVNPKYYGGDYNKMIEILLECKNNGTEFLVGGRTVNGVFKVLEDCEIPSELKEMFISIPEEKFRVDISSTELRKTQRNVM